MDLAGEFIRGSRVENIIRPVKFKEIRVFEIRSMERLTKKTRTEMTIDDIEQAVNKVIDEGKLDKYSIKVSAISVSEE